MLKFLKEKLSGGASRLSGKTDLLEATCAATLRLDLRSYLNA